LDNQKLANDGFVFSLFGNPGGSDVRGSLLNTKTKIVWNSTLSYLAYVSANCNNLLANLRRKVDPERIA